MGKLTKDQIAEIKILVVNGTPKTELARRFGVSVTTIRYHLGTSWSVTHKNENREYIKNYMRNRYQTDPEFRKRICATNMRYSNRRKEREKMMVK